MDEKRHFTTQEVLDWFAVTKPIPKKNISPPKLPCPPAARTVNKHVHVRPSRAPREPPRPPAASLDDSYADLAAAEPSDSYYQQLLKLEKDFANPETGEDGEERLHDMSETGLTTTSVFENYSFDNDSNPKLPISSYRDAIVRMIESGQVTIIQGCTGSGKSTQVPQYILEHYARERRHCNIICTQPRRIAAVSVAKFVAKSRGWRLGSLVGYQIAMDKFVSEDTRLNFVTTGVLLQKLVGMKNMNQYTHIILDEVSSAYTRVICVGGEEENHYMHLVHGCVINMFVRGVITIVLRRRLHDNVSNSIHFHQRGTALHSCFSLFYQWKLIIHVECGRVIFGKHSKFSTMHCRKCNFVMIYVKVRILLTFLVSMKLGYICIKRMYPFFCVFT